MITHEQAREAVLVHWAYITETDMQAHDKVLAYIEQCEELERERDELLDQFHVAEGARAEAQQQAEHEHYRAHQAREEAARAAARAVEEREQFALREADTRRRAERERQDREWARITGRSW